MLDGAGVVSRWAAPFVASGLLMCGGAVWAQSAHPQPVQQPQQTVGGLNPVVSIPMDAKPANINFDVVSFKRCPEGKFGTTKVDMPLNADYLAYHCETMVRLIYFAYLGAIKVYSLAPNYPKWVDTNRYEFVVKVAPEDFPKWKQLSLPERRVLIRKVLTERTKLQIRVDDSRQSIYALTVSKNVKLKEYKDGDQTTLPDGRVQVGRAANWVKWNAYFQGETMAGLAEILSAHLDRLVLDRTNLTGRYTFEMPLIPGDGIDPGATITTPDGDEIPSVLDGLNRLGLRLDSTTGPVERMMIDHIEPPEED